MTDQTEQEVDTSETTDQTEPKDEPTEEQTEGETEEGQDGSSDEDEEIEEEVDGVKLVGKKSAIEKIKTERELHAGFTRKTQELAEIRKDLEFQREAVEYRTKLQESYLSDVAEVRAIDKQLQNYANLNWDALIDADPVQAMKLERQARQLQAQRDQAVSQLTQKQQAVQAQHAHESAKLLEQGRAVLAREIPNFNTDLAAKLREFGKARGYSEATLNNTTDPAFVIDLYKQYKASEVKKATRPKPEVQEKPVTSISAKKSSPTKDPEKMSMDEWLKWRNSQVKNRNR